MRARRIGISPGCLLFAVTASRPIRLRKKSIPVPRPLACRAPGGRNGPLGTRHTIYIGYLRHGKRCRSTHKKSTDVCCVATREEILQGAARQGTHGRNRSPAPSPLPPPGRVAGQLPRGTRDDSADADNQAGNADRRAAATAEQAEEASEVGRVGDPWQRLTARDTQEPANH